MMNCQDGFERSEEEDQRNKGEQEEGHHEGEGEGRLSVILVDLSPRLLRPPLHCRCR